MSTVADKHGNRTRWTRYMERVADLCELRDWRIVWDGPIDEDDTSAGHCVTVYGRKVARISLSKGMTPEQLRHALVHELVHCHTDPASALVQRDLEALLEERVDRAFWLGFRRAFEYGVDGIATALAKHVPLPPKNAWRWG